MLWNKDAVVCKGLCGGGRRRCSCSSRLLWQLAAVSTLLSSVVCRSTTRCATERRWNISARSTTTPTDSDSLDPSLRAACLRRRPACASVVGPHRNTHSVASSDIQRRSGCLRSGTVMISVLSGRRCRRRRRVMFVGFSKNSRMERSRTERPSALSRTVSTLRSIQQSVMQSNNV